MVQRNEHPERPLRLDDWILILAGLIALAVAGVDGFWWLWGVLADYINPETATERTDLANILVLIVAGVVGTLTALAAVGNVYFSRKTLQQQKRLDEQRARDNALQAYLERMGDLLIEHRIKEKNKRESL